MSMSNDQYKPEEQEQTILELYEVLFQNFDDHRTTIKSLYDLTNEYTLVKILQEIEPDLLLIAEVDKIKITKEKDMKNYVNFLEDSPNICSIKKLSNFQELLSVLGKYFQNCPEKNKLKENFNLNNLVKISEVIKVNSTIAGTFLLNNKNTNNLSTLPNDLIVFGEILLVLSAVSTKRVEYLDILCVISDSDDKYLTAYLNILEKYIIFQDESQSQSQSQSQMQLVNENNNKIKSNASQGINFLNNNYNNDLNIFSTQNQNFTQGQSHSHNQSSNVNNNVKWVRQSHNNEQELRKRATIKSRMNNFINDKEKSQYLKSLENFEKEILDMNKKNEELTNELLELELKYRDALRENESLKYSTNQQTQFEEESFNDAILISNLKNELMKKELEMEDIKRQNDLEVRRLKEDINRYVVVKESLEDKVEELKNIHFENVKLKLKIRELNLNKEKLNEFDTMATTIEEKNKQIEKLIKEKQNLINSEKLYKENNYDKEKLKELESINKNLENEVYYLKRDFRIPPRKNSMNLVFGNNLLRNGDKNFKNEILNPSEFMKKNSNNNFNILTQGIVLGQINDFSVINPEENILQEDLQNQLESLQAEYDELNKMYKEQIESNKTLYDEQSNFLKINEKLKLQIDELNSEKDKILIDKEKLEISKQKIELELQKSFLNSEKLENEKLKIIYENNQLKEKNENLNSDKSSFVKELESLKVLLKMKNNQIDKILSEKQMLINEHQNLYLSHENIKLIFQEVNDQNNFKNLENNLAGFESKSFNSETKSTNGNSSHIKLIKHGYNSKSKDGIVIGNISSKQYNEVNDLKVEISKLKANLNSKEETIKQLRERIKNLEKLEILIKNKESKVEKDLLYYKKSYEEQKVRLSQEHELLSNSLCDLGMQFTIFKNELLKNVKPSILQANHHITGNANY